MAADGTNELSTEVNCAAQMVWDYLRMDSDVAGDWQGIVVCCSSDLRVATFAAELLLSGTIGAKYIVFSGGFGTGPHSGSNLLGWTRSEAEMFGEAAIRCGVSASDIVLETESKNSGDNVEFTRKKILELGLPCDRLVLVQKPFMLRRAFATFRRFWPEPELCLRSMPLSWQEYPQDSGMSRDTILNIMVGDLQRMRLYCRPPTDFQIPQEVPDEVWHAFEELVAAGYTANLVPGTL